MFSFDTLAVSFIGFVLLREGVIRVRQRLSRTAPENAPSERVARSGAAGR